MTCVSVPVLEKSFLAWQNFITLSVSNTPKQTGNAIKFSNRHVRPLYEGDKAIKQDKLGRGIYSDC